VKSSKDDFLIYCFDNLLNKMSMYNDDKLLNDYAKICKSMLNTLTYGDPETDESLQKITKEQVSTMARRQRKGAWTGDLLSKLFTICLKANELDYVREAFDYYLQNRQYISGELRLFYFLI
jgi:hypothetical protein